MTQIKNMMTPDLGGATDVTVVEVLVKPGDKIEVDTPVVTLESDKATMDIPAPFPGVVAEIKVKVGDKVSGDTVLMAVKTEEVAQKVSDSQKPTQPPEKKVAEMEKKEASLKAPEPEAKEKPAMPAPQILSGTVQPESEVHAGPGVRRMARELGVNLSQVLGSGPKQRIMKEDIDRYVKTQLTQVQSGSIAFPPAPIVDFGKFGPIETVILSRIKKISGKNLLRNWMTIPHVTQFGEADITSLEEFRQSQKEIFEKQKVKLTPLVFIMKAIVSSLRVFPHFNASLDPQGENLILKKYFHLGVAVDTPDGLVVPVIRDVNKKGLFELAKELAVVSEKARQKQLTPMDMQGGCFSISSLGGIGGTAFTPIINAPEVAILGVSKTAYKPVYENGIFAPRLMLPLSLSYDHRVIDGADGARFIMHLTNMLTDIRSLLL